MAEDKWIISDAETDEFVPPAGFIREYYDMATKRTDAPSIYHLGSILTVMASAAGQLSCYQELPDDGGYSEFPMRLWTTVIGNSGDRKSAAMKIAVSLLRRVAPERVYPADGSIEQLLKLISDNPIGLLHFTELSNLFQQFKRSYSTTMQSVLLSLFEDDTYTRETLNNKYVIERPRLNILGGIPSDVMTEELTKYDWSSGFIPRMTLFGSVRERYNEFEIRQDPPKELLLWIEKLLSAQGYACISVKACVELINWEKFNVELLKPLFNSSDDIISSAMRLRSLGQIYATLYAISEMKHNDITSKIEVAVRARHIKAILPILTRLLKCLKSISAFTQDTPQTKNEKLIIEAIKKLKICSIQELSYSTNISVVTAYRLTQVFELSGIAQTVRVSRKGTGVAGAPAKYFILTSTIDKLRAKVDFEITNNAILTPKQFAKIKELATLDKD